MNIDFIFQIIETAVGVLNNHVHGRTEKVVEGVADLERLIKAGNQAVRDQAGKPIDPGLVAP